MTIAQGSPCTLPSSPVWQVPAPSAQVILSGADGAKTVCAWLRDAAGNVGSAQAATITLDTSIPTNPSFTSLVSGITNQPTVVGNVTPISDGTTAPTYQCLGGQYGQAWSDCAGSPPFSFTLVQNTSNTLGIRARDDAYNTSAGSLVTIVHDNVAPVPPFITKVRTTLTSLVLAWNPSPDPDVASYRVYYGNSAGDFSGTGAAQGPSPVYAGPASVTNFTLTGLSSGRPYYVAVEAVDQAGNASGPSGQRYAVPNKVNPRVLSSIGGKLRVPAVRPGGGHTFAYVAQNQGVVQLQVDSDVFTAWPTGRATVPNLAPDEQAPLQVVDCTYSGAPGHCVIPTGSTLEGDAKALSGNQAALDNLRASPPIVFFPFTGTPSSPSLGLQIGALPARPHRLVAATISGQPGVYAVEQGAVKAYNIANPLFPRLLWTAPAPYAAQTILGAGLLGTRLLVYAQGPNNATPDLLDYDATGTSLVPIDRGPLKAYDGSALGAYASAMPYPYIAFQGGGAFYVAYSNTLTANTYLSAYTTASQSPAATLTLFNDGGMGELEVTSIAAGNNHAYVFAGNNGTPYVAQAILNGTSLSLGGTGSGPGASSMAAGATVAAYGSPSPVEHLLAVDVNGTDYTLQRWVVQGTTIARDTYAFREIHNDVFAESDHLVFAAQGATINVIDASNPLAPVPIYNYTYNSSRTYAKLVAHGRYLFAVDNSVPNSAGIDVFRINGNGTISFACGPFGAAAGSTITDVVVVGNWVFVAGMNGIYPYYFNAGGVGGPYGGLTVAGGVSGLDVRPYTNVPGTGTTQFLIYASVGFSPVGIQTFTWRYGSTVSVASPQSAIGCSGPVRARGGYAVVGTCAVDVSNPALPSVYGEALPVGGPVQLAGGYVVGPAPQLHGPNFTQIGSGAIDGTMLYSQCTSGSLAEDAGVYFAGCGNNGLQLLTVADPLGGTLLKSYGIGGGAAALAGDGMYSWLAGGTVSGAKNALYSESEQLNAAGVLPLPGTSTSLPSTQSAAWMLFSDGLDYVIDSDYSVNTRLVAYETTPTSLVPHNTNTTIYLPAWKSPGTWLQIVGQPVTDGERIYIPYDAYSSSGRIDIYDVRDGYYNWNPSPTTTLTSTGIESLAVARDRLYAGTYDGRVLVWDVSNFNFANPRATVVLPNASAITGLAVSGRYLFYTDANGELGVVLLGTADRDGSGAMVLGMVATPFQLGNPTIVGDVLYASGGLGTATFDLTPLWTSGSMPTPLGGTATDPPFMTPIRFYVDGPFAYLVGGVYRAFDLR
jgi:hypothetical protein